MSVKEKLQVKLFPDWTDYSYKNPHGPVTFIKRSCKTLNPLQISYALYKNGKVPNLGYDELLKMCMDFGAKFEYGNCLGRCYGECAFGKYASAIFKVNDFPWYQIWHLSNGKDFIFATYICEDKPDDIVLEEAHEIVVNLDIKIEKTHWWKR